VEVERGADGALYMRGDPQDPEIKLTLPSDTLPDICLAGPKCGSWLIELAEAVSVQAQDGSLVVS